MDLQKATRLARQMLGMPNPQHLYYIAPGENWSLDWDGRYITTEVQKQFGLATHVTSRTGRLVGHLVHYGSLWSLVQAFNGRDFGALARRNDLIGTVFHGDPRSERETFRRAFEALARHHPSLRRVMVSNRLMETRLAALGLPPEKLACIPLGVDLNRFRPASPETRAAKRAALDIPPEMFVIGSFHKDADGWGEGLEPKAIKGPDVLLAVIDRLRKQVPVFVYLTAPARGYVKQGLERMGVRYRHDLLDSYDDVPACFQAIDAYLVPSREEGGPKGILEAMATGVPLVSTRVGLAPDVVNSGENGLLADSEDVEGLARHLAALAEDRALGARLAARALETIQEYDWSKIAARYYREVYAPLLKTETRG